VGADAYEVRFQIMSMCVAQQFGIVQLVGCCVMPSIVAQLCGYGGLLFLADRLAQCASLGTPGWEGCNRGEGSRQG
jgi:hypothetical protein